MLRGPGRSPTAARQALRVNAEKVWSGTLVSEDLMPKGMGVSFRFAANDEDRQLIGKAFGKARIHGLIGKGLPLNEYSPLSQRHKIGDPYIGPLRTGAHIDEL